MTKPARSAPDDSRAGAMMKGRQADSARRRQRVLAALDRAAADGTEISVSGIARAAAVDRTFIYRHRDLLEKIHALEAEPPPDGGSPGPAVTRASLQADLLAAHERAARLNARVRQLEKRLSETLGEQAWRESGLAAPADIDALNQMITHLEQQVIDLRLQLEEQGEDLTAARAANRELMAQLNTTAKRGITTPGQEVAPHLSQSLTFFLSASELRKREDPVFAVAAGPPEKRGWAAYHRSQVSSETFSSLGHYTWKLTWKWARWSHPGKGTRWTIGRYYGKFCPSREDKWVFGDRDTSAYLLNHAWTGIRRHVMVKGRSSPDDPDLTGYWENRRRKKTGLALDAGTLSLLARQENKCPHCGDPLIDASSPPVSPEEWEDWWLGTTRQDIPRAPSTAGPARPPAERGTAPALMHMPCHRARTATARRDAA